MRTNQPFFFGTGLLLSVLVTSCAGTRDATALRDGVYDKPSSAPIALAAAPRTATTTREDDYYNAGESQQQRTARGYYDMAYNDPYYYNYGRFGFGMGVGMGMGTWGRGGGWGMGVGNGWNDPFWGDPWYGGWGGYNPYWNGYYGSYWSGYYGYGPGPYFGPYGNCWGCYMPVVIGDGAHRTRVGHRSSITGGNGTNRSMVIPYDPVGLRQNPTPQRTSRYGATTRPDLNARPGHSRDLSSQPTMRDRPSMDRERGVRGGAERSTPSMGSSPSRSSGGSFGGGSGGGTRSSGGRR